MKTIARFDAPEDAYLFRAFLDAQGVDASVLDENVAQLFWHYRAATGGVRVVIHDEDDLSAAEEARREYFCNDQCQTLRDESGPMVAGGVVALLGGGRSVAAVRSARDPS